MICAFRFGRDKPPAVVRNAGDVGPEYDLLIYVANWPEKEFTHGKHYYRQGR